MTTLHVDALRRSFGGLRPVFELPTSDSAIFNRITTDLETVQIGNRALWSRRKIGREGIKYKEQYKNKMFCNSLSMRHMAWTILILTMNHAVKVSKQHI